MSITRHIPNTITLGNLFCGCLAIVKSFEGDLVWAAYLVGIAAILDFLDGFLARMLKAYSPLGKDLDSLADMVTFGVVPGVMLFVMIKKSLLLGEVTGSGSGGFAGISDSALPYAGFVITIFSCLRLAIFNNDIRQSESFIGLPTPANAIFIASLPLLINLDSDFSFQQTDVRLISLILNSANLCIMTGLLSLLLVSELPLFSLKFKRFGWKENRLRYVFLLLSAALVLFLHEGGITLVIMVYVLMSFVNNIFSKKEV